MIRFTILFLLLSVSLFAAEKFKPAAACGDCHSQIYQQWILSVHANSTPRTDPLFRGMYRWAIQEGGEKMKRKCIVCHSPLSTVFDSIDPDKPFNREGVTCQFCHGTRDIKAFHSARDMQVRLDTLYSFQPAKENAPHPVADRPFFATSEFCLPCHAEMKSPGAIDVCATGHEWNDYFRQTGQNCQDCHMPKTDGYPGHQFPGGRDDILLKKAVEMGMDYLPEEKILRIRLANTGAGHAIPTGTPLRMVVLKVRAFNAEGEVIWENWKKNPIREDRSALFMKLLGDARGASPVPPWQATQIVYDRRLMPGVPDTVTYRISDRGIQKIEAKLLYRLAPPPILARFGITDPQYTRPRLMARAVLNF